MKKLIQVEIIVNDKSSELEKDTNKFLIERKMSRENLIDIKYQRDSINKSVLIIYEINMSVEN